MSGASLPPDVGAWSGVELIRPLTGGARNPVYLASAPSISLQSPTKYPCRCLWTGLSCTPPDWPGRQQPAGSPSPITPRAASMNYGRANECVRLPIVYRRRLHLLDQR